jgi:hypothetical protein
MPWQRSVEAGGEAHTGVAVAQVGQGEQGLAARVQPLTCKIRLERAQRLGQWTHVRSDQPLPALRQKLLDGVCVGQAS